MASSSSSSLLHIFIFSVFVLAFISDSKEFKFPKPNAFIFPIRKDDKTLQFYTELDMGTPNNIMYLVIDLGGPFTWVDCDQYNTSTYRRVPCFSPKCLAAIGGEGASCIGCRKGAPRRPGCTDRTCALSSYNPKTNLQITGGVGEDAMRVSATDGMVYLNDVDMRRFSFACGVTGLLSGLANGTKGIVGLGRTPISLATQLSNTFRVRHRFALCLPSTTEIHFGTMFVGGGPYFMPPYPVDASNLLIKIPLIINHLRTTRPPQRTSDQSSEDYFIHVKGIKVDGKPVSFNTSLLSFDGEGVGGTMISTVTYYTVLHSNIYKALVGDFVKAAAAKKMERVGAVAPFGACFSSKNIANTMTGPAVPSIDLVVKGNNTTWRIYGANSIVKVKKNVLCLGFVDGGSTAIASIVIGAHQLENNLLEFDLATSSLGFSSSLLLHNSTCSQSRLF